MMNDDLQKLVSGLTIPQLADLKVWADKRLRVLKEEHDATARQLNIALGLAPRVRSDKGTKRAPKVVATHETRGQFRDTADADPFAVFDRQRDDIEAGR